MGFLWLGQLGLIGDYLPSLTKQIAFDFYNLILFSLKIYLDLVKLARLT